jgi:DNA topoisomerase-1
MAKDLPKLRKEFLDDLAQGGYSKDRVCAGIVLLISHAWFRVGSDRYEKENSSFGITTLRKSHVELHKEIIRFKYKGKRGIENSQKVTEPRLIAFVLDMMSTPGRRLFRYLDGKRWVDANARDVNEYIEKVADFPYTAKDFRTWGGSLRAATVLSDLGPVRTKSARNRNILTTVRVVAAELGNTPAICRKSYVHPMIFTRYLRSGATIDVHHRKGGVVSASKHTPEETALINFLDVHFPDRRGSRRVEES